MATDGAQPVLVCTGFRCQQYLPGGTVDAGETVPHEQFADGDHFELVRFGQLVRRLPCMPLGQQRYALAICRSTFSGGFLARVVLAFLMGALCLCAVAPPWRLSVEPVRYNEQLHAQGD